MKLSLGHTPRPIGSLQEASLLVQAFAQGMGYEEFYAHPDRGIVREGDTIVARVSFNGRVWDASDKVLLFEATTTPRR